ncbi:MAG: hypothetical protein AB7W59_20115 [Acidimicrobiia bacterium]
MNDWSFHKVGHRWMLAYRGWAQGSFPTLDAAVIERNRRRGYSEWQRIVSERAA